MLNEQGACCEAYWLPELGRVCEEMSSLSLLCFLPALSSRGIDKAT